jgi:spore maturation protein CgeB
MFATPVRIMISRSRTARTLLEPLALRKFNLMAKLQSSKYEPQLVLAVKGEAVLPSTINWFSRELGATTALWYPDDPRYFDDLSKFIAPVYDFVFTASARSVSKYQEIGVTHVEHLPFACEPTVHKPITLTGQDLDRFSCDVCFVGTFSRKRLRLVRALERAGFNFHVWGQYWRLYGNRENVHGPAFGPDLTRIFNGARIVLNIHDESDVGFKPNMRTFEAAGCRSLLLSDRVFGLERSFRIGQEVACYLDEPDLVERTRHYLESSTERTAMANRAHNRAYQEHTYEQRLRTLLNVIA